MPEIAILATIFWGAAVAMAVVAGEDFLKRGIGSIEQDLKQQLKRLRISGRRVGTWLRVWIGIAVAAGLAAFAAGDPTSGLTVGACLFVVPWLLIRRAATEKRIPCFTSVDTARAAVDALIASMERGGAHAYQVRPIHEYRDGA